VAEELVFGKENITSGATGDIQQATKMAKAMVTQMGYSDELGTVAYGATQEEVFRGMSMGRQQAVSESTAQKIDAEVRRLVDEGYQTARRILTEKRRDFETLAQALLEYETLTGEEIKKLIAGEKIDRSDKTPRAPIPAVAGSSVPTTRRPPNPFGNPSPAGA
jgi:cell division protease FtsH